MLVGQLFELSGGRGREGVNTRIPKQTCIPVICQDARMCVCLSVYVGCPEPNSPPLDPYILDTCDLFCATMSHARDVVNKSEILGVAVHSCALPEGEGCGPMGNHNTIGFLSNTGQVRIQRGGQGVWTPPEKSQVIWPGFYRE